LTDQSFLLTPTCRRAEVEHLLLPLERDVDAATRGPNNSPLLQQDSGDGRDALAETSFTPAPESEELKHLDSITWAPTIIYFEDISQYVELRCHYCQGNAAGGKLLGGVWDFHHHLRNVHNHLSDSLETVVRLCKYRTVPQEEVDWILETRGAVDYVELTEAQSRPDTQSATQNTRTPLAFASDPNNFIGHCGCVVKHPLGEWVELRCPICDVNSLEGRFIQGCKGFFDHLRDTHSEAVEANVESVIARCAIRVLVGDDVSLIKSGKVIDPPITHRYVKSTTSGGQTSPSRDQSPDQQGKRQSQGQPSARAKRARRRTIAQGAEDGDDEKDSDYRP
jgi:hypothetical protein